jgi:hypothetical protein
MCISSFCACVRLSQEERERVRMSFDAFVREFEGNIACHVPPPPKRPTGSHMDIFLLDREEVNIMNPSLPNKPVKGEHGFKHERVGVIKASWVTDDWTWKVKMGFDLRSEAGRRAVAFIDMGFTTGLSLTHDGDTYETVEVSLCERPARDGCYITDGIRPWIDHDGILNASYYKALYDKSKAITASFQVTDSKKRLIVASLPPKSSPPIKMQNESIADQLRKQGGVFIEDALSVTSKQSSSTASPATSTTTTTTSSGNSESISQSPSSSSSSLSSLLSPPTATPSPTTTSSGDESPRSSSKERKRDSNGKWVKSSTDEQFEAAKKAIVNPSAMSEDDQKKLFDYMMQSKERTKKLEAELNALRGSKKKRRHSTSNKGEEEEISNGEQGESTEHEDDDSTTTTTTEEEEDKANGGDGDTSEASNMDQSEDGQGKNKKGRRKSAKQRKRNGNTGGDDDEDDRNARGFEEDAIEAAERNERAGISPPGRTDKMKRALEDGSMDRHAKREIARAKGRSVHASTPSTPAPSTSTAMVPFQTPAAPAPAAPQFVMIGGVAYQITPLTSLPIVSLSSSGIVNASAPPPAKSPIELEKERRIRQLTDAHNSTRGSLTHASYRRVASDDDDSDDDDEKERKSDRKTEKRPTTTVTKIPPRIKSPTGDYGVSNMITASYRVGPIWAGKLGLPCAHGFVIGRPPLPVNKDGRIMAALPEHSYTFADESKLMSNTRLLDAIARSNNRPLFRGGRGAIGGSDIIGSSGSSTSLVSASIPSGHFSSFMEVPYHRGSTIMGEVAYPSVRSKEEEADIFMRLTSEADRMIYVPKDTGCYPIQPSEAFLQLFTTREPLDLYTLRNHIRASMAPKTKPKSVR